MRKIHFIGIGGVGMNGLAQLAIRAGNHVTGSDRAFDPARPPFAQLHNLGIALSPQDGHGIDSATTMVVYSSAIEPDNPDLTRAEALGIPRLHRAEFLAQLVGKSPLIAIAGTAGKTTTTGMLGWIFECLDLDPTVYNGAALINWRTDLVPGNVRAGKAPLWIIEADESDKSFLRFHPTHSIITNISRDHYELDELHTLFTQFRHQTSGTVIEGRPLPEFDRTANGFVFNNIEFTVPMLGRHNLENALCAVRLCAALGLDLARVRDALARFCGIERRLETVPPAGHVTIIDDYAHNAAKIAAALEAASEKHERVHAYWRPHGFTPLHQGLDDLAKVFARHFKNRTDSLFILPVYYAGGTVQPKSTAHDLVNRIVSAGAPAEAVSDYAALEERLTQCVRSSDAVLGMGARDPQLPLFAKKLASLWN